MSHKVSTSHRGLRDLFQALISRPDRGGRRAPKNEDESEPQTQDQDVRTNSPPKGHAAMAISLSFISGSTVSAGTRNYTSREERKVTVEKLVSSAIASFGNSGQREMSLAVVDEPLPGNKYARVMFNNLSRSLNGGPGELLTHLTQDVFIEPSSKVQERRGRYPVFTDFTLEPNGCFEVVGKELGDLHNGLLELQDRLRSSIGNPFITATDDPLEEIPILDFAIAVFEGRDDAFVEFCRLRLSAEIDLTPAIQAGGVDEVATEANLNLLAVWERRSFPLRVDFLVHIEGEMEKMNGETNCAHRVEEGHEVAVPRIIRS